MKESIQGHLVARGTADEDHRPLYTAFLLPQITLCGY